MATEKVWSKYQSDIFDWIQSGTGDAIVNALAGSGKTTTLVEAARRIKSSNAIFCAFNSHVAKELGERLNGTGMECATIHSLGLRTVRTVLGNNLVSMDRPEAKYKYNRLAATEARILSDRYPQYRESDIKSLLSKATELAQCTLAASPEDLQEIIWTYNLMGDFDLRFISKEIAPAIKRMLEDGIRLAREEKTISFSDMVWLPHALDLQPRRYDWILVDEAQDLNAAQRELVLKMRSKGGRSIFVGDYRQAIYGFAGADYRSFWKIKELTRAAEFPLSICYRCPVLVIREAQELVPQIEAAPAAEMGTVRRIKEDSLHREIQTGDLVLCRLTAPLVKLCLELISRKIPARVKGKDIAWRLLDYCEQVAELKGFSFARFVEFLDDYTSKQAAKLRSQHGDEADEAIESLTDKSEAIKAIHQSSDARTIEDFCADIEELFADYKSSVTLSTIHKAKGLEERRVFIIKPHKLPLRYKSQTQEQYQQELNLKYVAITRAMSELVWVEE